MFNANCWLSADRNDASPCRNRRPRPRGRLYVRVGETQGAQAGRELGGEQPRDPWHDLLSIRLRRLRRRFVLPNHSEMTSRFQQLLYLSQPRAFGESNYTLRKLISHAFNIVTGYSALPLKLASIVGFVLTMFGLLILSYVLIQYFVHGGSVPGFAFLASIITIFSGTQMFVMGIFGEYLARIHFRTLNRPPYFIRGGTDIGGELQQQSGQTTSEP